MNLMELLQLADDRLRPLCVLKQSELQPVLDEVAAGPRPEGRAPELTPAEVLAGRLFEVEIECQMLREKLGVQFTPAAKIEVKLTTTPAGPAPSDPDSSPA